MTEDMIARTVKEFETALRIMNRDKSTSHVFDIGTAAGVSWSMLILAAPTEAIDMILEKCGGAVPSKPLQTQ